MADNDRKNELRFVFRIIWLLFLFCVIESGCGAHKNIAHPASIIYAQWEQLDDMPRPLGRYSLACDGSCIYMLGGVRHNIRSGQAYMRSFTEYNPSKQLWRKLASAPFGTGYASLSYWPDKERIVAIAGIRRLGDDFDTEGITVGIYDRSQDTWEVKKYECPGLGLVKLLIHCRKGRFLVLTRKNKTALLDLDRDTFRLTGTYPNKGRNLGKAKTDNTLYVLTGGWRKPAALHSFDLHNYRYKRSINLKGEFQAIDCLFSWQNRLFIWKNSGPYDRKNPYSYSSVLLQVNPDTGAATELRDGFKGARSRRSSSGMMLGDSFYIFGGQRRDTVWLKDVHRCRLILKDK